MSRAGLLARVLAAAALAAATLLLYHGIGRFDLAGPELLPEAAALVARGPDAAPGWQRDGRAVPDGADGLHLQNDDPRGKAVVYRALPVPPGASHLSLAAELRLQDVAGGIEPWHSARVLLTVRDPATIAAGGDWRYDLPHTVLRERGSSGWQEVRRAFPVPEGGEAMVTVQLLHATGDLWLRRLSLQAAVEKPWFPHAAHLLAAAWLAMAAWAVAPLAARLSDRHLGRRERLLLAATLAVAALIAVAVLLPHTAKQAVNGVVVAVLEAASGTPVDPAAPAAEPAVPPGAVAATDPMPPAPEAAPAPAPASVPAAAAPRFVAPGQLVRLAADKIGHFTGFALLALLAGASLAAAGAGRRQVLAAAAALAGFAALTETWQVMAESRGASLLDIGIDLAGLAFGALLWLAAAGVARRLRRGGRA